MNPEHAGLDPASDSTAASAATIFSLLSLISVGKSAVVPNLR